ncbi:MAG: hypothetical protein Q9180_002903, partial [Flavoplaca navasiana]
MGMDAALTPTPPHIQWAGQHQGNDGEPDQDHTGYDTDVFIDAEPRGSPGSLPQSTFYPPSPEGEDFTLAAVPLPVLQSNDTLRKDLSSQTETSVSDTQGAKALEAAGLHDDITDTVGAIAVDCLGNIAAGSSSGGIGMKHRGRIGPAAL